MQVQAKVDVAPVQRAMNDWTRALDAAVAIGITRAAQVTMREMVGPEGLKKYPRHKGDKPSPPGEPPAQRTTKLRTTVRVGDRIRRGFAEYEQVTGPTMVYARAQEFGNPRQNLPARPYVQPAFERVVARRIAYDAFVAELARRLGGAR
jgi:hypothetical protein